MSISQRALRALGDEWCGNRDSVPGAHLSTSLQCELFRVVSVGNDGFELWLGTPDEWAGFMNRRDARKLAWFILLRWWGVGEWFGLRRWLYYKALHRVVSNYPGARAVDDEEPKTP